MKAQSLFSWKASFSNTSSVANSPVGHSINPGQCDSPVNTKKAIYRATIKTTQALGLLKMAAEQRTASIVELRDHAQSFE